MHIDIVLYNIFSMNKVMPSFKRIVCVCSSKVTPVFTSCVIAAAILLPLGIMAVWFIYKLYKYLYPKTNLPEHLKVCLM